MRRNHLAIIAALVGVAVLGAQAASAKCSPPTSTGRQAQPGQNSFIYFDTGSAKLKPEERKKIVEQAKTAKANYVQLICLRGSADKKGDPKANERLSNARAQAVAAELAKNGIARKMIETDALGEPGGGFLGGVNAGSNADRRVEIRFTR
jgi:OmpA-OmpF porin, OOP family